MNLAVFSTAIGFVLMGIMQPAHATTYTVTAGSASDLQAKINTAVAGDTIQVPAGTYSVAFITNSTGHSGTSSAPVTLVGTGANRPIFDFGWSKNGSGKSGFEMVKNYWNVSKIEFRHSTTVGVQIYGSNNTVSGCYSHNNWDSGFQIYGTVSTYVPSNNLIQNCDSFYNSYDDNNTSLKDYGSGTNAGNADGFAAKFGYVGTGNQFTGCRSYYNGDDGFDFWLAPNQVTVTQCICYRNGYFSNGGTSGGDGNGFKMGGGGATEKHSYSRCIASFNLHNGFDYNGCPTSGEVISQCTGYANGARNFRLSDASVSLSYTLTNNLSVSGVSNDNPPVSGSGNVWEPNSYSSSDFSSTSISSVTRDSSYALNYGTYLHATTSAISGKGAN
jgi:hypothetical protein